MRMSTLVWIGAILAAAYATMFLTQSIDARNNEIKRLWFSDCLQKNKGDKAECLYQWEVGK